MAIAVGQTAPDFTLKNQYDKEVKLSDFEGKKNVVLMFYPLDWSPTCTQGDHSDRDSWQASSTRSWTSS